MQKPTVCMTKSKQLPTLGNIHEVKYYVTVRHDTGLETQEPQSSSGLWSSPKQPGTRVTATPRRRGATRGGGRSKTPEETVAEVSPHLMKTTTLQIQGAHQTTLKRTTEKATPRRVSTELLRPGGGARARPAAGGAPERSASARGWSRPPARGQQTRAHGPRHRLPRERGERGERGAASGSGPPAGRGRAGPGKARRAHETQTTQNLISLEITSFLIKSRVPRTCFPTCIHVSVSHTAQPKAGRRRREGVPVRP